MENIQPFTIQIDSVTKYKKEKFYHQKKKEPSHLKLHNLTLIDGWDHHYHLPLSTILPQSEPNYHHNTPKSIVQTKPKILHLQQLVHYFQNQDYSQIGDQCSYQLRDFEDSNLTKHISEQILILKILMMILAVLSMFLSHIRYEINSSGLIALEDTVLIGQTLITLPLIFTHILLHFLNKQLSEKQLIKFSIYQISPYGINSELIVEFAYLLIHPNILCKEVFIEMLEPIHNLYQEMEINDLLQIVMLARVYLLFSAIIYSSIYMSTRANRVCRIYGTNCDRVFGMKCVFNEMPLMALLVIFLSLLIVFAQMVRLSEQNSKDSGLREFGNSLWCVIITMATVGYGDYYPTTYLGRLILFLASISGIILSSLLILTLSTYLSMQISEIKSHITLQRLKLRESLEQSAGEVIKKTAEISKEAEATPQQKQKAVSSLKKKSEDVKYIMRKIKNMVDTNNVNEEMDRLFESLGDNIKHAYINQCDYAELLTKLAQNQEQRICDMKFSFTEEIQNFIKDE